MMKQLFLFYKLECKRTIKLVPHMLLGAIALSLVIGAIVFCTSKMIYINKNDTDLNIAYSVQDDNYMTNMIVQMITGIDSLSSVCNFIQTSEEESQELLNDNDVLAAITIPDGFMKSISSGKNFSIKISFPVKLSLYSVILTEFSKAIEITLSAAQASIYTLYDFYEEQDMLQYENKANSDLNAIYLSKSLNPSSLFKTETISATNELSLTQYYICAGFVLLILMLGTTFIDSIKSNSKTLNHKLIQSGVRSQHIVLSKIIAVSFALFILLYGSVLLIFFLNKLNIVTLTIHPITALFNSIIFSFCASCIILFIISLSKGKTNAILLLFILITVMGFISGCFIPKLFLPNALKSISDYLPTTHIMDLMTDIIKNNLTMPNLLTALASAIFLYLCTVFNIHIKKGW